MLLSLIISSAFTQQSVRSIMSPFRLVKMGVMKRVLCLKPQAKLFSTNTSSVMVELVSEKIITPSSLTPKHLSHYKLSFIDQQLANQYLPITLFYPNISSSSSSSNPLFSSTLEKSLAKLLSFYYPCAGKLVHNSHVDCNDMGALFREIRIKGLMFETLAKEYSIVQGILFPEHGLPWAYLGEGDTLFVAQLTHFDCGGIAISLCLSHKICDGIEFCQIFNDWAELAKNSSTFLTNPPALIGSSILRPKDDPFTPHFYALDNKQHISVTRLNFNLANIKRLQTIIASESDVKDPTRFEVVTALLNRCATISSGSFHPYTIISAMNLRKLLNPPVPNYFGNFISVNLIDVSEEEDLELPKLVSKIRKQKMRNWEKFKGKSNNEILEGIIEEEIRTPRENIRIISSLCGCNFYDIDFGWGRPARVSVGAMRSDTDFVLVDAPPENVGVHVFAGLDQNVALKFKTDKDLLEFAEVDLSY